MMLAAMKLLILVFLYPEMVGCERARRQSGRHLSATRALLRVAEAEVVVAVELVDVVDVVSLVDVVEVLLRFLGLTTSGPTSTSTSTSSTGGVVGPRSRSQASWSSPVWSSPFLWSCTNSLSVSATDCLSDSRVVLGKETARDVLEEDVVSALSCSEMLLMWYKRSCICDGWGRWAGGRATGGCVSGRARAESFDRHFLGGNPGGTWRPGRDRGETCASRPS